MATEKQNGAQTITIAPPNLRTAEFTLIGTAPYVQHAFSAKARNTIMAKQASGSRGKKGQLREARDFDAAYKEAMHIAEDGWHGIPAPSFRNAMISACRLTGFAMTRAKLSVFIEHDGIDKADGTPLVKIEGEPVRHEMMARNETGVVDVRVRPMWKTWKAKLRVRFDADQFSHVDVANLLMRVGEQVGIGEGRPDSKKSGGLGWGTFHLAEDAG